MTDTNRRTLERLFIIGVLVLFLGLGIRDFWREARVQTTDGDPSKTLAALERAYEKAPPDEKSRRFNEWGNYLVALQIAEKESQARYRAEVERANPGMKIVDPPAK